MNFVNSIKQSFLVWINGTSLDLRYVLMRSPSPTKYAYGDEHYRIKFKDSTVESPCSLDNIIVHKGFSLNFQLFLNEIVDCRWCCYKQEQKQGKKLNKQPMQEWEPQGNWNGQRSQPENTQKISEKEYQKLKQRVHTNIIIFVRWKESRQKN